VQDGLTGFAVAGSYVVLLGWDMSEADIKTNEVLGIGIQRTRHSDGEVIWLTGMKTFKSVDPHPDLGVPVSTFRHPIQSFQWADYTASPGQAYTYRVVAMQAPAGALLQGANVSLTVTTESVDQGTHAVHFNRGAIASQEYARRFQNLKPSEVGQSAYDWLSRGLLESLEQFIAQSDSGDELHGAFFEFKNSRVYSALKAAKNRGVTVKILYDGDTQRESNETHLADSGIKSLTKARTKSGRYAHNKFLVWRSSGTSQAVWTGSTNLSENGVFGHSNNAHIVRNPPIAEQYELYWQLLHRDLTRKPTATEAEQLTSAPPTPWTAETVAVFSPRLTLDALDWYADLTMATARGLFATFAFGMNERFVEAYDQQDDVLRFALMEKKGNGSQYAQQAAEIDRIRKLPNVTVSVGHHIELNAFDRWLAEIDRVVDEAHVLYVHTKYILIDPLGDEPVVIVGSANFSAASTDTNDENMLVIRGNPGVADIYLGEFMRLFSHYAFRESLRFKGTTSPAAALARKHLIEDASWVDGADGPQSGYFVPGADRTLRRRYFSGQ
jgi:phosphatidylserine/phosphatidylglycerophosphate/cardiolipin synthase-like enzyme